MSDLEPGKYWIQNAAPPKSWIGVIGSELEEGVVTEGKVNIWIVEKTKRGFYTLTLEDDGRRLPIRAVDGKLVVNEALPQYEWNIQGPVDSLYTIAELGDIIQPPFWTVNDPDDAPKTPVTLNTIVASKAKQQWNFIRWPGSK